MRRLSPVLALAALAVLGGCAAQSYPTDQFRAQYNAPYTLASGDRIRVIVFGQDSLSNSYAVSGAGRIALPLGGDIEVGGKTTIQAQQAIESHLRAGFLRDPHVSVEVEAYRPFFVLGEVTTAGQYPYINGMTVQKAVAVAGGFTPRAFHDTAAVTRMVDGKSVTGSVPLTFPLRPGDTVTVQERIF